MDEEEFEKREGKSHTTTKSGCSVPPTTPIPNLNTGSYADEFEGWEDYMDYGMGGRRDRDYFGLKLKLPKL